MRLAALLLLAAGCTPAATGASPLAASTAAPPAVEAPHAATPAPAAPPRKNDDGDPTTPKLRLGHYSSRDGSFGLVLDRTGATPRAMIDGTTEVVDFAIRRQSDVSFAMIGLDDVVVIDVSQYGRLTAFTHTRRDIALYRDADAKPLDEPKVPAVDATLFASLEKRAKTACGATVHFEASGATAKTARGYAHELSRAARALERVCKDDIGKSAVTKNVRTVRVTSASENTVTFSGGTLAIAGKLEDESLGVFTDKIQSLLQKKL